MMGEDFIKLLDGVRQTSRGWSACCPAHDDSTPSLGISIGNDNRILVHCFAGCSVQEICEALEIQVRDLFPIQTNGPRVRETQCRRERERIQRLSVKLFFGRTSIQERYISTITKVEKISQRFSQLFRWGSTEA